MNSGRSSLMHFPHAHTLSTFICNHAYTPALTHSPNSQGDYLPCACLKGPWRQMPEMPFKTLKSIGLLPSLYYYFFHLETNCNEISIFWINMSLPVKMGSFPCKADLILEKKNKHKTKTI